MATSFTEQETIITISPADDLVRIWSNIPAHVRKMRKDERYEEGDRGAEDSGFFTVPRAKYRPLVIKAERNLTPEQKAERSERMRKLRASQTK